VERFEIPGVGTLEGFLTDGLRSLLDTIECPDIEEKTLRYPGHADKIRLLRDSGFLDDREVEVGGRPVNVREFTFRLLDPAWFQAEGSEEFTAMIVEVEGGEEGQERRAWYLLDRTDTERGETSMARTTGFPAAICARRLLDGTAPLGPGVHPPEALAADDVFVEGLLGELASRKVVFQRMEG
jgi:saccharopine dehydrogenase-like NADP-dependent oxidoreductase